MNDLPMNDLPKGLIHGGDGKLRCFWPGELPDYIAYHDGEWGRPHGDEKSVLVGADAVGQPVDEIGNIGAQFLRGGGRRARGLSRGARFACRRQHCHAKLSMVLIAPSSMAPEASRIAASRRRRAQSAASSRLSSFAIAAITRSYLVNPRAWVSE